MNGTAPKLDDKAYILNQFDALRMRVISLEQQVAHQALVLSKKADRYEQYDVYKSQAAATQATEHLYAPLRSDTKPLLEMSAFVRKIADYGLYPYGVNALWAEIADEAREILKRST